MGSMLPVSILGINQLKAALVRAELSVVAFGRERRLIDSSWLQVLRHAGYTQQSTRSRLENELCS